MFTDMPADLTTLYIIVQKLKKAGATDWHDNDCHDCLEGAFLGINRDNKILGEDSSHHFKGRYYTTEEILNGDFGVKNYNYQDNFWHPWFGGICPVKPDEYFNVMFKDGTVRHELYHPEAFRWDLTNSSSDIVAYQVLGSLRDNLVDEAAKETGVNVSDLYKLYDAGWLAKPI